MNFLESLKSKVEILQRCSCKARVLIIKDIQDAIWDDITIEDEKVNDLLSAFAQDIDFYVPDSTDRLEADNYYGEDKLTQIVKEFSAKLNDT